MRRIWMCMVSVLMLLACGDETTGTTTASETAGTSSSSATISTNPSQPMDPGVSQAVNPALLGTWVELYASAASLADRDTVLITKDSMGGTLMGVSGGVGSSFFANQGQIGQKWDGGSNVIWEYKLSAAGDTLYLEFQTSPEGVDGVVSSDLVQSLIFVRIENFHLSSSSATLSSSSKALPAYCNVAGNCGTATDVRNQHTYRWTKIGEQTWLAENLRNPEWDCNEECMIFGSGWRYKGDLNTLCPEGWRVPLEADFRTLFKATGNGLTMLSLMSSEYWKNGAGTDQYGFTLLPNRLTTFYSNGMSTQAASERARLLTADDATTYGVSGLSIDYYGSAHFISGATDGEINLFVRCLKKD